MKDLASHSTRRMSEARRRTRELGMKLKPSGSGLVIAIAVFLSFGVQSCFQAGMRTAKFEQITREARLLSEQRALDARTKELQAAVRERRPPPIKRPSEEELWESLRTALEEVCKKNGVTVDDYHAKAAVLREAGYEFRNIPLLK